MENDRATDRGEHEGEAPRPSDRQSDTSDAEQAVINQERAFESGEENPV